MTPVGMLSRIASVKRRRFSSSRLFASRSCVISLKARTRCEFVDGAYADFVPEIPSANLLRGPKQSGDRNADLFRQEQGEPCGEEQDEQRDETQQSAGKSA